MKAVRVHEYGGPDVLQVEDVPLPTVGSGQLLLRVVACGVNPLDAWFRSGHLSSRFARTLPYTPGTDVVGIVIETADDVTGFENNQLVMGVLHVLNDGGYAEFVVADAERLIPLPEGLDPVLAAALMTPSITGLQMVDKALALRPCRKILILGALGSVGRAAVRAALELGLDVTAVVRRGREEEAASLGVNNVETGDDPRRLEALAGTFDCILDMVGPQAVAIWESALVPGGHIITIVPLPPAQFTRTDTTTVPFAFNPNIGILARISNLALSGGLKAPDIKILDLTETAEAHALLPGSTGGRKFVVVPIP